MVICFFCYGIVYPWGVGADFGFANGEVKGETNGKAGGRGVGGGGE